MPVQQCICIVPETRKKMNHRMIGCFSAISRVTGELENDLELTALMHMHGGLALWDYSSAGHTTVIDMNPQVRPARGLST